MGLHWLLLPLGARAGGTTTTGGSIDISFSEMLDNLDFGLMGAFEARRGPLSIFVDALYLDLSKGQNAAVGPGIPANADIDVSGTVLTTSVGYDVERTPTNRLVAFGGVRGINLENSVNIGVAGRSQRISGKINNWDAIVGIRGESQISERWGFSYYADVGAGESDLTTQISLSLTYAINDWDLAFGYRYLDWKIGNSPAISDLTFDGPFIGARVNF